jgi:3D (Asp-Asp-Asp) domain-containing protein
MILADSIWRKFVATVISIGGLMLLYEVTALDSKYAARQAVLRETTGLPGPGVRLAFTATAYCKGETTASGVATHRGIAAADPLLLPVGSVVELNTVDRRYNGIYTIMDTGPAVQGRELDLYMWNCTEAQQFGRRPIHIVVLRLGWNPRATTPGILEKIFRRKDAAPEPLPSRPITIPLPPQTPGPEPPATSDQQR